MRVFLLLPVVIAIVQAVYLPDLMKEQFESFMVLHGKSYQSPLEKMFRMKIFMENLHKISKHNKLFGHGFVSYSLGINKYTDILSSEFTETMNGFNRTGIRKHPSNESITFIPPANVQVPDQVDWRKQGAVTEVKDQGHCGSCWSFSATGSLEGQHFRKTGILTSLSEQNLLDCSASFHNHGCDGGLMDNAFAYIKSNHGIDTEKSYPYKAKVGKCHFEQEDIGATDSGFVDLPMADEDRLKQAVATIGPVSVAIDASHDSFQMYAGGVYYEPACSQVNLDHGVLVVGYGTDEVGRDFWIVKNSWGEGWGEAGYIRMARNRNNHCGIASAACYPLV